MLGKFVLGVMLVFFTAINSYAQSIKKVKTEVTFKNLGKYITVNTTRIDGDKKRTDSDTDFKGSGFVNNTIAKLFLKSGSESEITDLPDMKIFEMDHKKKEYRVIPITPYQPEDYTVDTTAVGNQAEPEESQTAQPETKKEESDVKLVRKVFKVEDTSDKKSINGFNCNRYTVLWVTVWENVKTKETVTDSLLTNVWTTPLTGDMQDVEKDEMAYNDAYMKKLGFEISDQQKEMLGTQWVALFNKMKQSQDESEPVATNMPDEVKEMNKIKGYPVVIDGSFFFIDPQKENEAKKENEVKPTTNVKKLFGRFARKVVKKKLEQPKETGPDIHFYTEVLQLKPADFGDQIFEVSAGYKKQ